MNNPEKVAATLAIRLIAVRRQHPIKALFQMWPRRSRVEKLANLVLEKDDLPIEPCMTYVVDIIVRYFEEFSADTPLPTEQEVIDWIAERGGIPALLLTSMARTVGWP
jgi:hypothetical protein